MPVYPKCVAEAIRSPEYSCLHGGMDAEGSEVKLDCGCFVTIGFTITGDPQRITSIGYRSNGCGYMIAAAEAYCRSLDGAKLVELHGLADAPFDRLQTELEPGERLAREPCFAASARAVKSALAAYRFSRIEEFAGERALICTCFGVSEDRIAEFIAARSPESPADIADALGAGSGCGSCRMLIQEMIDTASSDASR